jgi:hypothetical protein
VRTELLNIIWTSFGFKDLMAVPASWDSTLLHAGKSCYCAYRMQKAIKTYRGHEGKAVCVTLDEMDSGCLSKVQHFSVM